MGSRRTGTVVRHCALATPTGNWVGVEVHERSMKVAKRQDCLHATRAFGPGSPTVGCPATLAMDLTPTHTGCFPDSAVNIIGYTSSVDAIFVTDQEP